MRFALVIFAGLLAAVIATAQTPTASPSASPSPSAVKKPDEKKVEKPEKKKEPTTSAAPAPKKPDAKLPFNPKDLIVEDLQVGAGKAAAKGKTVKVHYTGWLYDAGAPNGLGKQIDSSLKRGEPWSFVLGSGQVIKGWDEGFRDMKVGGKRRLIIPSEMGYGKNGARTEVPPNAPLLFEIELVDVVDTM